MRLISRSSGADRNRHSALAERVKAARRAPEWVALIARKGDALRSPALFGAKGSLYELTRAAKIAAALRNNLRSAIACGI